jgi:alpha-beta hydrolase superfamily lysophospholipase
VISVPLPPSLSPLEMTILASDGLILRGVLAYPESPTVRQYPLAVLAHQYPATAESYAPLTDDLLDRGIAVLAFDERGHGGSTGLQAGGSLVIDTPVGFTLDAFVQAFISSAGRVGFHRIDDDIVRVASWGVAQNFIDAGRIILVGASVGGTGAVLAAPRVPALRALVTFGAAGAPAFGEDAPARARKAMEQITARCWLGSSEADPFDGARNVRDWSHDLGHVTAKLTPGSAHAMAIYYDVRGEVLAFLDQALGRSG